MTEEKNHTVIAEIRDDGNITISLLESSNAEERSTVKTKALLLLASLSQETLSQIANEAVALQNKIGPRMTADQAESQTSWTPE